MSQTWPRFVRDLLVAAALVFAALFGIAVGLDPYDTGRFAVLATPGVPEQGPRTAGASRGRDPTFDGLILGNSHVQLISPAELGATTGIPFLSLAVPATGPKEQFVLLDYFLVHRVRPARAVVIGVDPYWCTPDPAFSNWQPFPFFLYDPSPWRYLAGLLSDQTFDAALQRALYALGLGRRRRARPDGYWNYEDHRVWRADVNGPALARAEPWAIVNESGRFPQIDALARRLASLAIPVVLVRPPAYVTTWPRAGTPLAAADAACGEAIRRLVVARPRTALVDWRSDRPENRDATNFLDGTHYRAAMARTLEREIAAALDRLGARLR